MTNIEFQEWLKQYPDDANLYYDCEKESKDVYYHYAAPKHPIPYEVSHVRPTVLCIFTIR